MYRQKVVLQTGATSSSSFNNMTNDKSFDKISLIKVLQTSFKIFPYKLKI